MPLFGHWPRPETASDGRRPFAPPPNRRSATSLGLYREAHAARADQPRKPRLEAPQCAAARALKKDVAVVRPAEGEVGGRQITVGHRHNPENDAARINLQDAAEPRSRR